MNTFETNRDRALKSIYGDIEKARTATKDCQTCGGTGRIHKGGLVTIAGSKIEQVVQCDCVTAHEVAENRMAHLNALCRAKVPDRYLLSDFAKYRSTEPDCASQTIMQWCTDTKWAVFMYGPPGTGKTHLACAVIHYAVAGGVGSLFVSCSDFLAECRTDEAPLAVYRNIPLLVVDDVGIRERATDNQTDLLFRLVDYRYREGKRTVFTSNKAPSALVVDDATHRIMDRFSEGLVIEVKGESARNGGAK